MTQVWPDLVLMDHMMPDMDGVETTQHIREMGKKDPYFAVVPIIALTANAMKGVREEFLRSGFNDFLPKPIELDKLDNTLRAWVPEDKQKAPVIPLGTLPGEELRRTCKTCPASTWSGACPTAAQGTPTARPSFSSGSRSPATSAASGRTGRRRSGRITASRSTA